VVDKDGQVRWLSWVNHIHGERNAGLLPALQELLQLALPQLELVSGQSLRPRRLQVVVRAYEQELKRAGHFYRITDWHTDGHPHERIIATAACYVDMDAALQGGGVEFAHGSDAWLDDPEVTKTALPRLGSIIAFNNAMLRHRVGTLSGIGRRRLVAFHLVDPEYSQKPPASELSRQWRPQEREELLNALAVLRCPAIALIADFAAGGLTAEEILLQRNAERRRRIQPTVRALQRNRRHVIRRTTTMVYF